MIGRFAFSFIFFLSLIVAICQGLAADPAKKPAIFNTEISGGDLQFLTSAAEQGLLQANLAALAGSRAKSSEVKDFARTLAKQHAGQNERIKLIAVKKGLALPTELNARQNATADKLSKLQGLKFDKAYLEEVIQDEQSYEMLFEQASRSNDVDIKSLAAAGLPEIKQQLTLVRTMAGVAPRSGPALQFRAKAVDRGKTDASPEAK